MNNIVKSVVFAAVVLFAGIAAMQVIYKNSQPEAIEPAAGVEITPETVEHFANEQTPTMRDAYERCVATALVDGDEQRLSRCNLMWQKVKEQ
jgi:hypothetical protein